jgi:exodeoxyribonuclease VII small subunit
MKLKKMKYNQAIEELEKIVEEIENEEISVDDLAKKVKRASQLIEACKGILSKTEADVEKILKDLEED